MRIGFSFFWQIIPSFPDPNKPGIWQHVIPNVELALDKFKEIGIKSVELKFTEIEQSVQII